ncbi:teashirt 1-like, partial [Clarias magur]
DELKAAKIDEEHLQDDGLSLDGQDTEYLCNEEEDPREQLSYQNSPLSNGTNPDAGYGSPLSDTSDHLADFKSTSSKEGQERDETEDMETEPGLSVHDSLAKMKAAYANLISNASWSSITRDIIKSKQVNVSNNSTTSNHKGSNSLMNSHAANINSSGSSSITTASVSATTSTTPSNMSAALAKTLQHTPYHLLPEPSLFSTVQLYRQNNKLYGPVFTGASKFRCKDCSAAYDTLVGLTVHMNETGHYRDDNKDQEDDMGKKWSKPRKRSLMEMEGKEDAQKVLKCMYCGHSFESLQDLSVHMIKTKHYQKVPLKEPMPALASKLVPSTKKRVFHDLVSPCSPESSTIGVPLTESTPTKDQKVSNPYVTANNRYGYQNGASYTWQFEARKAQILKCMECGSSHDTLQQLTAHMMVTGHFLKVTNSASKKGKQLVFDPVVEEKIQSIPLPPTTTRLPVPTIKSQIDSPLQTSITEERKVSHEEKKEVNEPEKKIKEEKEDPSDKLDNSEKPGQYKYLREEDLEETPKEGLDILKSLENTVSSAISKAQTGTPTWGGYPSIHAAYQLQGSMKSLSSVQSVKMQPTFSASSLKSLSAETSALIHSPESPSPPPNHKSNVLAMEELVEKVTGKIVSKKEKDEKPIDRISKHSSAPSPSPVAKEKKEFLQPTDLSRPTKNGIAEETESIGKEGEQIESHAETPEKNGMDTLKKQVSNGCSSLGIITDHSPEQPLVNHLSALQSIMNTHLGKASKTVSPLLDPLAMLYKISNNMVEKPFYSPTQVKQVESINRYYDNEDQPIDLTKSKNSNG